MSFVEENTVSQCQRPVTPASAGKWLSQDPIVVQISHFPAFVLSYDCTEFWERKRHTFRLELCWLEISPVSPVPGQGHRHWRCSRTFTLVSTSDGYPSKSGWIPHAGQGDYRFMNWWKGFSGFLHPVRLTLNFACLYTHGDLGDKYYIPAPGKTILSFSSKVFIPF